MGAKQAHDPGLYWAAVMAALSCALLGGAAVGWWTYSITVGYLGSLPNYLRYLPWISVVGQPVCFIGGAVGSVMVVRAAKINRLSVFRLCAGVVALLAAFFAALSWFDWPMHDLALSWGGHGRWGCIGSDEHGSPYFWTSETVPLFLFAPSTLIVLWRGVRLIRRTRLAQTH